jgi:hypothetical protein
LPSMLLTGIGVGLALPTLISTTATALPADRFATGAAIVNTSRQVASALGVAVLVTILGTPASPAAARAVFQHGWIAAGAANLAAAIVCLRLRRVPAAGADGQVRAAPLAEGAVTVGSGASPMSASTPASASASESLA